MKWRAREPIKIIKQELTRSLRARYKKLFEQVITPVMTVTNVFLIASHWEPNNPRVLSGLIATFVVFAVSLTMMNIKKIPTPWGTIQARSDVSDTLRWCFNFPASIYIVWSIDANLVSAVSI
jgi:hypothetical protein